MENIEELFGDYKLHNKIKQTGPGAVPWKL